MKYLSTAERQYFSRKLGGVNDLKNTTQIKREYFVKFLGAHSTNHPFNELEGEWMSKVIGDAGGTPTGKTSDLWKQMVISISKTPVNNIDQNKLTFYLNAA